MATAAAFKEWELKWMLLRNPFKTSDKTSNRQSINTGLRSNPTMPALKLVECGRACKLSRTTMGNSAMTCLVTQAYQMGKIPSMLVSMQTTLNHA
jgi:hypothetical protein